MAWELRVSSSLCVMVVDLSMCMLGRHITTADTFARDGREQVAKKDGICFSRHLYSVCFNEMLM